MPPPAFVCFHGYPAIPAVIASPVGYSRGLLIFMMMRLYLKAFSDFLLVLGLRPESLALGALFIFLPP